MIQYFCLYPGAKGEVGIIGLKGASGDIGYPGLKGNNKQHF